MTKQKIFVTLLNGEEIVAEETTEGRLKQVPMIENRFIPAQYESYFFLDSSGTVMSSLGNSPSTLSFRLSENNVFKTLEEAKRKNEILSFIHNKEYNFNYNSWSNTDKKKYFIEAQFNNKSLVVNYTYTDSLPILCYFYTFKDAEDVIRFVGFDDWCKYVMGIN